MAVKLFALKNVPEDEAAEVRRLLTDNAIDYYETPERIWGISVPAIWLHDTSLLQKARSLLDAYEAERAISERAKYLAGKRRGEVPGVVDKLRDQPLRFLGYCVAIFAVLYFSIKPFFAF